MKKKVSKSAKVKTNILLIIISLIVFTILFIGIFNFPNLKEKTSQSEEIEKFVKKYVNLYIGLINVSVENVEKYGDGYKATINATSYSGPVSLELYLHENLTVYKLAQILQLPEKPRTIIEIPYRISCSSDKIAIDIYIDPYDKWSRRYDNLIQDFIDKYNVSEIWRIIRTDTHNFEGKDAENAFLLLKYFECMKDKESFKMFRKCIYEKIDEIEKDGRALNESEIIECLDPNVKIEKCLEENSLRLLSADESFALTYLQTPSTPMIVIDCKYKTWPTFIENVYCYLYKCD